MKYDIAAYVWPAYTGESATTRIFWEKGIGEWQTVLASEARFEGQIWPRRQGNPVRIYRTK